MTTPDWTALAGTPLSDEDLVQERVEAAGDALVGAVAHAIRLLEHAERDELGELLAAKFERAFKASGNEKED